jgi:hypothetical protein
LRRFIVLEVNSELEQAPSLKVKDNRYTCRKCISPPTPRDLLSFLMKHGPIRKAALPFTELRDHFTT